MKRLILGLFAVSAALAPRAAAAQIDPLLFIKDRPPNIIVMVDTVARMQRDVNGDFIDNNVYKRLGGVDTTWETALGVDDSNTSAAGMGTYRRKYVGLKHQNPSLSKFETDHIEIVGDLDGAYATFDERTKIAIARRSLAEAITRNTSVARFGLMRTRQQNPRYLTPPYAGATLWDVNAADRVKIIGSGTEATAQKLTGDDGINKYKITRALVDGDNGAVAGPVLPLVAADANGANSSVLGILGLSVGAANSLLPAGADSETKTDTPVDLMLTDLKQQAADLIARDTMACRNTVAVMVVSGGKGNTSTGDTGTLASQFVNVSGHRVPVHVIAIVPPAADVAGLQAIATNSGGVYTEITAAMVNATTAGQPIPELVRAVNYAVQHGFAAQSDCDAGVSTEHQVTSPTIGTVNLENATDINGSALPNTIVNHTATGVKLPQRSNVMVTSGFSLPGFDGKLRAFRVYKPVADATRPSGYKFSSDGTRLWVAGTPAAASRNIYTALPNGTVIAFNAANAVLLQPYLRAADLTEAATIVDFVRSQPLGAIVGSTPAIMDAPSLDPPPDADYPGFADANKNRRSIIWVGANDGMLHAIDARVGQEVWAFIPFNLLPKLRALRSGQPVGDFRYFVDSSPKVADVKVNGDWRTYLIIGQGAGGTFYQTFDVTLDDIATTVAPDDDDFSDLLTYFASSTSVPLKWSFPSYTSFDVSIGDFGDIAATATNVEKTVGETWSDPAVGQIETASGRFVVLAGSGFLKYSVQQQANRGGVVAGTTFYVLDAETGAVLDSESVGNDGKAETVDNCALEPVNGCTQLKNALQADPVATGPPDSRFITKSYVGDLDGRIWRFDIHLNAQLVPEITSAPTKLFDAGAGHPLFTSMATINVGTTLQYLFQGTGSELLPSTGVSQAYKLLVILDNGPSGTKTAEIALTTTDGSGGEEKVTAFPAVAGDIVFFGTTTFQADPCLLPTANLYAFTFIGGPAYDTDNSGTLTSADSTRIRAEPNARATAPFIVDQHVVFGTGSDIQLFGDPDDFNNGVGQAGVRILSWREVR